MRTLKITKRVKDLDTGEVLKPGTIIEKSNERAKAFAKYSEDITEDEGTSKPKRKRKKKE